jgi:hypothetical protein
MKIEDIPAATYQLVELNLYLRALKCTKLQEVTISRPLSKPLRMVMSTPIVG